MTASTDHRTPQRVSPRVPATGGCAEARRTPQDAWLDARRGQAITVRLLDGKTLVGTLVAWDVYTLHLAVSGRDAPTLVYKHAVAYLAAYQGRQPAE